MLGSSGCITVAQLWGGNELIFMQPDEVMAYGDGGNVFTPALLQSLDNFIDSGFTGSF
jgi:hypothetical protein